jgi:hypothetical protein
LGESFLLMNRVRPAVAAAQTRSARLVLVFGNSMFVFGKRS